MGFDVCEPVAMGWIEVRGRPMAAGDANVAFVRAYEEGVEGERGRQDEGNGGRGWQEGQARS